MTEGSVDTFRLSDIDRKCFCTLFHTTLVMITRFVIQWRHSVATNCFPSVRFLFENKCACCKHTETTDDVLEKLVSLLRHFWLKLSLLKLYGQVDSCLFRLFLRWKCIVREASPEKLLHFCEPREQILFAV